MAAIAAGLGVSALFVWLLLRGLHLEELADEIVRVHLGILAVSLATDFLSLVCMSARSHVMLRGLGDYSFYQAFKSVLLGYAGNTVFPLRAGELLRVGYLAREGETSKRSCLAIVAFERLIDAFVVMAIFLATVWATLAEVTTGGSVGLLAGVLTAMVAAVLLVNRHPEPVRRFLARGFGLLGDTVREWVLDTYDRFVEGLESLSSPRKLGWVLVWTLGNWCFVAVSLWIVMLAFDLQLAWYAPLIVLGFAALGNLLPSSPGNVGTYEYFATAGLTLLGVSKVTAASYAIVQHAVGTLPMTILGIALFYPELANGAKYVLGGGEAGEIDEA